MLPYIAAYMDPMGVINPFPDRFSTDLKRNLGRAHLQQLRLQELGLLLMHRSSAKSQPPHQRDVLFWGMGVTKGIHLKTS